MRNRVLAGAALAIVIAAAVPVYVAWKSPCSEPVSPVPGEAVPPRVPHEAEEIGRAEPELARPAEVDLGEGRRLLWAHGSRIVKCRLDGRSTWWRELDFPVADVRRDREQDVAVAVSVDGLRSARIAAESGEIRGPSAGAREKEIGELVAKAQRGLAKAQEAHAAGEKGAVLAECRILARHARDLSRLGRADEAWRIWTEAKKLEHAARPPGPAAGPPPGEDPEDMDVF